jgi:uncharacterized protein YecE (DUF72 family)
VSRRGASRAPWIGTAGWSLPPGEQAHFPGAGTHLERYARVFNAVEINSTFHRPHRATTYARWAASVPDGFRFSVKLPRAITHDARLAGARKLVDEFLRELAPLGHRVGCLLVQLPPSLELAPRTARSFLGHLRETFAGDLAIEPRHASWFEPEAEALLARLRIARVAADPPRAPRGAEPGGWGGVAYYRLHGSPRVYYSSYPADFIDALAAKIQGLARAGVPAWCIFDNTTLGAGTGNALAVRALLQAKC